MVRIFKNVSIFAALFIFLGMGMLLVVWGTAQEVITHEPEILIHGGMLEAVTAESIYIFDLESQTEIFSRDAQTVRPIASVTKLLSSAMFFEHAPLTASTTITWPDIDTEGRSGRLHAGQQYKNKELLFPALLESSNDASVVMNRVAPVDLVDAMNSYTEEHGLEDTHFTDTSGLDDGNVSTAYQLGSLASFLYAEYPHIIDVTRLKTYLNHINAWMNNNPFVHTEGYRGGKHGYTYAANRTAVAFFDEEMESGQVRTIVYVLLGSETLQTDIERLRTHVRTSVTFQ